MLALLIPFAAAVLQPTADQLLDEAARAAARGDRVTAQRKLLEAKPLIDRGTEATRERLAAHVRWDDCVKANARRVSSQAEKSDVLADAVLGMCLDNETSVKIRASDAFRYIDNVEGEALRTELEQAMNRWREIQRQTALAIIVAAKLKR